MIRLDYIGENKDQDREIKFGRVSNLNIYHGSDVVVERPKIMQSNRIFTSEEKVS